MNLIEKMAGIRQGRAMQRAGALLVSASLAVSLVVQPPKAKAVAPLAGAALGASMIYSYMQSAGITMGVTGATAGDLADAISPYLGQFEAKLKEDIGDAGLTFSKWLGYDDWDGLVADLKYQKDAQDGLKYKIFVPKAMSAKLAEFTKWFAEKLGLSAGTKDVEYYHAAGGQYIPLADGGKIVLSQGSDSIGTMLMTFTKDGDAERDLSYTLANGKVLHLWTEVFDDGSTSVWATYDGTEMSSTIPIRMMKVVVITGKFTLCATPYGNIIPWVYMYKGSNEGWCYPNQFDETGRWIDGFTLTDVGAVTAEATDISVSQADELAPAVDTSEKELPTVITVPGIGAEITDIADLLGQILDKIAANDLTAEGTIAAEEVVDPEPEEPTDEVTDVDGLGLPALGAALVTRFPFSIPWDLANGVKLLAAPAKTPYFEVDFLAPIGKLVGGWKGSTKIVLDFSQFETLGALCRWVSTVGFCLFLAGETKRFIWTA